MHSIRYCWFVALIPCIIQCAMATVADSSHRAITGLGKHVTDVYQFSDNGSFIDNLVLRHNGNLLLTRIDVPQVWSVDPRKGTASLVFDFSHASTGISSCFGITEVAHDVFTVVTGEFDVGTFSATPGSFSVWKLDFTVRRHEHAIFDWRRTRMDPKVTKLVDIPEAKALGASTLFKSRVSAYLLLSESPKGMIWKVDLRTSQYSPALSEESMLPIAGGPAMGVNGIKVFHDYLYYASVTRGQLRRVALSETASAIGPSELVMNETGADNLDISGDGKIYLAVSTENKIVELTAKGRIVQVVGAKNSTVLAGPTCCVLSDNEVFIGTSGGELAPVNGWFKEPAKVSVISI